MLSLSLCLPLSAQANQTATKQLSITVASALSITTTSLPGAVVGQSYTATLAAAGGVAPYTWSVSSGALPAGLTMTAAGAISGTVATSACAPPGPCTISFTVTVTDSSGTAVHAPVELKPRTTSHKPVFNQQHTRATPPDKATSQLWYICGLGEGCWFKDWTEFVALEQDYSGHRNQ